MHIHDDDVEDGGVAWMTPPGTARRRTTRRDAGVDVERLESRVDEVSQGNDRGGGTVGIDSKRRLG